MSKGLLLIGYSTEGTLTHVFDRARAQGECATILDLARLRDEACETVCEPDGELVVRIGADTFRPSDYGAIYSRMYYTDLQPPGRSEFLSSLIGQLTAWLQHCDVPVANRPSAGAENDSKLCQLLSLRECGFAIPHTIITGDPDYARRQIAPKQTWINKGCSGTRTETVAVDPGLYGSFDQLLACPSLFQQRIIGPDVRVHVAGRGSVALRIEGERIDYRYSSSKDLRFEVIETPAPVRVACQEYCRRERLLFSGFDFKIDELTGEWFVLEANPMPGYDFFDRNCDHEISRSLLACLRDPPPWGAPLTIHEFAGEPLISSKRRPTILPWS